MPFATITQKRLFYTIDPQSPTSSHPPSTTLFLHGLGSSSCFYKPIIPALTPFTHCIALDYPGSGLSSLGSSPDPQSVGTIAEDAIALLRELGVSEKIVVVGHSMGGIVASYIAAAWPSRVKAVVLLGPVDPAPPIATAIGGRRKVVENDGLEPLANSIPIAATGSNTGPLQHAFVRSLILGTSAEGYASLCTVIVEAERPDYGKITAPLLILSGQDDKTCPLPTSEAVKEAYGTAQGMKRIEILEGVGHWHCVEAPEEVARHVVGFINFL